ncbi:MAG: TetR/AcrR family transcriptional regulator C-terminal domain-containing protein [Spirochaetaceae bacterium]|nr:TetR/AcrR family transcriptional regulator C-terminal domain-containing protein [Spirochaetaceae bacterium]MDT8297144.1 TetR/AcrR family transcriptional regulator C-terminal domain-containing protein [Spirochaetaceae bacterium]
MSARRRDLTKEKIVNKAFSLADEIGVDRISMRLIAGKLGVQAMSLYNHVANKEDIFDELVERVVGEMALPDPNHPWKEGMRNRAHSAHDVLLQHPWAIQLLMTRTSTGPVKLSYVEATLACLIGVGFNYETADHAWNAMDSYIYGYTMQESTFPFEESSYSDTAQEFLPGIPAELYPHFIRLATMVGEGLYSGVHDFDFGLNFILDGMERLLLNHH